MDGLYLIVYFTIIDILKTYVSPFFILMLIIIYFQYRGIVDSPIKATITSVIYGSLGGVIATVLFIYLRIYIIPKDFIYIFVVAILLSLIDARFMCFAYGGSIVALGSLIFKYPTIDSQELMIVVAIFHLIESILILLNGKSGNTIDYFNIRGRVVQGYYFNRFWPLPFVIFIGDTMIRPMTLMAILNYGDFTVSNYPKIKTIKTAIMLFTYSSILFIIAFKNINPFLSPIFAVLGHEFIVHYNIYRERS
ncbi:MAG: hypothetical protein AB2375_04830 [Tissierellaceae bacterium]